MKVLITGGSGFLGSRLARTLLKRGTLAGKTITEIVITDRKEAPAELLADKRVRDLPGELMALTAGFAAEKFDAVVHFAAAVSSGCEADFDLGIHANILTTRALLESLRMAGNVPLFFFASSVAVYGSEPATPIPAVIHDETLPVPQSSYGVQKFICEQLVADYTRKGFIDGRTARLMTVTVRPGKPNLAASGFISGILREPLHGVKSVCPVGTELAVAVASPANTIDGVLRVMEASREELGGRTAINLPSITVTVGEMLETLRAIGGEQARALVEMQPNAAIEKIVGSWPSKFETARAAKLGLKADANYRSIVELFVEEEKPMQVTVS